MIFDSFPYINLIYEVSSSIATFDLHVLQICLIMELDAKITSLER